MQRPKIGSGLRVGLAMDRGRKQQQRLQLAVGLNKYARQPAAAAGIAVDEVRCCFTCGSTRVMALGTETRVIVVKKEGTPW
mmetsp:Transcript_106507/g.206265  ORF Transcript_106507/g.206265 Transcript_106507/m.206265 type:complete len:81 (+) Transcript_106507:258-500(+)